MNGNCLFHCCIHIVIDSCLAKHDIHLEGPTRDTEDRHVAEEIRKLVGIQCCRGNDELQVPPLSCYFLYPTQQQYILNIKSSVLHGGGALTLRMPKSTSVCNDLSCASSMIMQLYSSRSPECRDSLERL